MKYDIYNLRKTLGNALFFIILFSPIWSLMLWKLKESKPFNIMIIDKTVLNDYCVEHRSFSWILKYEKIVKPGSEKLYKIAKDYKGFFPKDYPEYDIQDLNAFSYRMLDSIADTLNMLYYTDAYGIYENEWKGASVDRFSKNIYGGIAKEEIVLMRLMKEKKKLLIGEFNILASPTKNRYRKDAEAILGVKWTGWTARYFPELDTSKITDLPYWVPELYKRGSNKSWDYKGKGMLFVNEGGQLFVLQDSIDLNYKMPKIRTENFVRNKYGILEDVEYPFWFDIVQPVFGNETICSYHLNTTPSGIEILDSFGLSNQYPAIIHSEDELIYYFAGDFADNKIASRLSFFEGVTYLDRMIYSYEGEENYRSKFFWAFYRPMVTTILNRNIKKNQ